MNELLISGSEKLFFWLLKHLNKRLLKKYFPLKEDDLQIKLENLPNIYINEQINHCNISFSISLKNYTNYDIFISFFEIELVINSYRFLNYDKLLLRNVNKKASLQFTIELPITYYQAKKVLMMSNVNNVLNANFELNIFNRNIFGDMVFRKRLFEKAQVQYIPAE